MLGLLGLQIVSEPKKVLNNLDLFKVIFYGVCHGKFRKKHHGRKNIFVHFFHINLSKFKSKYCHEVCFVSYFWTPFFWFTRFYPPHSGSPDKGRSLFQGQIRAARSKDLMTPLHAWGPWVHRIDYLSLNWWAGFLLSTVVVVVVVVGGGVVVEVEVVV